MFLRNKLFMPLGIVAGLLCSASLLNLNIPDIQAASLFGIVSDENGDPIEDARITIKAKKNKGGKKTTETDDTDSDGSYEIDDLKKGNYKLAIVSGGYEKVTETLKISENSEEIEMDFTLMFSTYTKTSSTKTMDAAVASYQEIDALRRKVPIDAAAIASAYEGELQDLTKEVDTENTLTLDGDILAAIEDIKNNNEPDLAAQVIARPCNECFTWRFLDVSRMSTTIFMTGKIRPYLLMG